MTSNTPFPSISELSRMSSVELDAVVKRADVALRSLHQADNGTVRNLTPAENAEFNVLSELRSTAEAHRKVRTVWERGGSRATERAYDGVNVNRGTDFDPRDVDRMGASELRDAALSMLDHDDPATRHLSTSAVDRIDAIVRANDDNLDGAVIAKRTLLTENKDYRSAFAQMLTEQHPMLTSEEISAVRAFREFERTENRGMSEGSGAVGLYGVPVTIDPTIILTNQESDNAFLRIARVEPITTNAWKGVSAAGATWSFDAEGVEVSDDSLTLAQPTVSAFTARGFIPYTIELGMDYPRFAEEMARILGIGYDDLLLSKLTNGNGTTEPKGLITKLDATAASEVLLTTAGSFGAVDLYKLWKALPQKWRRRASFMGNVGVNNTARQFSNANNIGNMTVDLTAYAASTIFGRPVYENDYFADFSSTTGHQNTLVCGSFGDGFLVAQRAGMSVEMVPHLFSQTSNRPNGQRGVFAWARVGSDAIVPEAFVLLNQT